MFPPKKLAIYLGYPFLVNGTVSAEGAAAVFKDYEYVVFASGLEDPTNAEHDNTLAVMSSPQMVNTKVYGSVDATLGYTTVLDRITKWKAMGAKGIFVNKFGYDSNVSRTLQNQIVTAIHDADLEAFVNCWNVDDAFSPAVHPTQNPSGTPCVLGIKDLYLAEGFAVFTGAYDIRDANNDGVKDFQDKAIKMVNYRNTYGTKLMAVSTYDTGAYDQKKTDFAYAAAFLYDFDGWGFGEYKYSTFSCVLPMRQRLVVPGTRFTSGVTTVGKISERTSNIGLRIDVQSCTVSTNLTL